MRLEELFGQCITPEANADLIRSVTSEEIRSTMFGIDGDKAPGPDGFTSQFFKAFWLIVGCDVIEAILYFFKHNKLLPAFNSTIVAIVPKCKNPESMKHFRSISCCTVIYKCITKILANRLRKYIPNIGGKN